MNIMICHGGRKCLGMYKCWQCGKEVGEIWYNGKFIPESLYWYARVPYEITEVYCSPECMLHRHHAANRHLV